MGIMDIALQGNRPKSRWPALAHAKYFSFPEDTNDGSVTKHLRDAMDLASTCWLRQTLDAPPPSEADPEKTQAADGRSEDERVEFILGGVRVDLGSVEELLRQGRGVEDLLGRLPAAAAEHLDRVRHVLERRE